MHSLCLLSHHAYLPSDQSRLIASLGQAKALMPNEYHVASTHVVAVEKPVAAESRVSAACRKRGGGNVATTVD
ncbi:MAG: hypothetical protein QGH33_19545 [Pirellulaceae bacterium]|jgi:hypothetical protein|nr:hypothetical protein [Pirellulaceae bacterium]